MKKVLLIVMSGLLLTSCATIGSQSSYVSQKDMIDAGLQVVDSFTRIHNTREAAITYYPDFFPKESYTLEWKKTETCISDDIDPQTPYLVAFIENLYKHQNGFVAHIKHSYCRAWKQVGSFYSRMFDKRITMEYHPLKRETYEKFIVVNPQKKKVTVITVESDEEIKISPEGYNQPFSSKLAHVYFFTLSDELARSLTELQSRIGNVKFDKDGVCGNLEIACKVFYRESFADPEAKMKETSLSEQDFRTNLRQLSLLAGFKVSDSIVSMLTPDFLSKKEFYECKGEKTFYEKTPLRGDIKSKIVETIQETLR